MKRAAERSPSEICVSSPEKSAHASSPPPANAATPQSEVFLQTPGGASEVLSEVPADSECENNAQTKCMNCSQTHHVAATYDRTKWQKKRLRKRARGRNDKVKYQLMMAGRNIKHTAEIVCQRCQCQSKGCKYVDFYTIKKLREEVYGEGADQLSIRQWRFNEIQKCFDRTKVEKARFGIKMDSNRIDFHIPGRFRHDGKDLDVCRKCWQAVTGACADSVDHIKGKLVDGTKADTTSVGGLRMKVESNERLYINAWIECYIQALVCYSPEDRKHELPGGLNLAMMHAVFSKDWKDGVMNGSYSRSNYGRLPEEKRSDMQVPSYSLFCKVWKKEYGDDYKIPKASKRFPQCNWCARVRYNIERAKTHEERTFWKSELFGHFLWVTANRKVYYRHREKARTNPTK